MWLWAASSLGTTQTSLWKTFLDEGGKNRAVGELRRGTKKRTGSSSRANQRTEKLKNVQTRLLPGAPFPFIVKQLHSKKAQKKNVIVHTPQ